jgi:hypothetical protein
MIPFATRFARRRKSLPRLASLVALLRSSPCLTPLRPSSPHSDEKKGIAGLLATKSSPKKGIAGLLGPPKAALKTEEKKKNGIAGLLGTTAKGRVEEKKGIAGLLATKSSPLKAIPPLSDQKAITNAALSNLFFAKKRLDASKFIGAGSIMGEGGGEERQTEEEQ